MQIGDVVLIVIFQFWILETFVQSIIVVEKNPDTIRSFLPSLVKKKMIKALCWLEKNPLLRMYSSQMAWFSNWKLSKSNEQDLGESFKNSNILFSRKICWHFIHLFSVITVFNITLCLVLFFFRYSCKLQILLLVSGKKTHRNGPDTMRPVSTNLHLHNGSQRERFSLQVPATLVGLCSEKNSPQSRRSYTLRQLLDLSGSRYSYSTVANRQEQARYPWSEVSEN